MATSGYTTQTGAGGASRRSHWPSPGIMEQASGFLWGAVGAVSFFVRTLMDVSGLILSLVTFRYFFNCCFLASCWWCGLCETPCSLKPPRILHLQAEEQEGQERFLLRTSVFVNWTQKHGKHLRIRFEMLQPRLPRSLSWISALRCLAYLARSGVVLR